jgi:hypothetical protein
MASGDICGAKGAARATSPLPGHAVAKQGLQSSLIFSRDIVILGPREPQSGFPLYRQRVTPDICHVAGIPTMAYMRPRGLFADGDDLYLDKRVEGQA